MRLIESHSETITYEGKQVASVYYSTERGLSVHIYTIPETTSGALEVIEDVRNAILFIQENFQHRIEI